MDSIKKFFGDDDKTKKVSIEETQMTQNVKSQQETIPLNNANQPNKVFQPKGGKSVFVAKTSVVDTKLTIIFVENTEEVAKEKGKLQEIVKSLVTTGYVCVINYERVIRESKIVEAKAFDCSNLLCEEYAEDNACLYDALMVLEDVVKEIYMKDFANKKMRIKHIDIIGIGRCVDNCSITSSEIAIEAFAGISKYSDVTTKYFCLSEESFVRAAAIGFHSIGAIARNYM